MKSRWLMTIAASIPLAAASVVLQSCAGVGGPITGGGGGLPDPTAEFLALLAPEQKDATYIGADACRTCHTALGDHWADTLHESKGVTCERCHGPGSVHKDAMSAGPAGPKLASNAMVTRLTNILTFPKVNDPVVCGQCHGPVHDQYNFSQHSKLVVTPVEEAVLNPATYGRSSQCVGCHSGLFRTEIIEKNVDVATLTDAEIVEIAEDTLKYVPHTANCSSCHDPHKQTGKLTDDGEEVQLRHEVFNDGSDLTLVDAGSPPAEFLKFDHSCATCHNGRGVDASDTGLTARTSRPSMHDSNQFQMLMGFGGSEGTGPVTRQTQHASIPGQCSKCHMPDSRHTFTVSFDKGCSPCHTASDAAARADAIKSDILQRLISLKNKMETWAQAKFGDTALWDYTSLLTAEGKTPPDQTLVPIEIKRARHNYYFVIRSGDYGVHNAPYAKFLIDYGKAQVDTVLTATAAPARPMSDAERLAIAQRDRKRASMADLEEIR